LHGYDIFGLTHLIDWDEPLTSAWNTGCKSAASELSPVLDNLDRDFYRR